MEDRDLARMGMGITTKSMEVMDDLIQALLAALANKSTSDQQEVLKQFAEYVKEKGTLLAMECEPGVFPAFQEAAEANDLTYYAVQNRDTGKVSIITRDLDHEKIKETLLEMAKQGKPMVKDPQIPLKDMLERYDSLGLVYTTIPDYSCVEAAKEAAAEANIEFSVAKRADNSYMVIYLLKDYKAVREAGLVPEGRHFQVLVSHMDLQDVREIVEREKNEAKLDRRNEKSNGRGM